MNIAETLATSIGRGVRRTVATAVIAAAAMGAPALAQPAMWAVKDADSTIYLFGTVHLLKPLLGALDVLHSLRALALQLQPLAPDLVAQRHLGKQPASVAGGNSGSCPKRLKAKISGCDLAIDARIDLLAQIDRRDVDAGQCQ